MSEQGRTPSVQKALDLALQHHAVGRLSQAEHIYKQVLKIDPNQPTALHFLGVVALQAGKSDVAVDLITKALAIKPNEAEAHCKLGLALQNLGKTDDALASYQKALGLKPASGQVARPGTTGLVASPKEGASRLS